MGLLVQKGNDLEKKGIPLYVIFTCALYCNACLQFLQCYRINIIEGFRTAANVCEEALNSIAIPFSSISALASQSNNNIVKQEMEMVESSSFNQFSLESFQVGPKSNKKSNFELENMLSTLGIKTPPVVIPELRDDDVSWFFDGDDEDGGGNGDGVDEQFNEEAEMNNISSLNLNVQSQKMVGKDANNELLDNIGRGLAHGNDAMMAIAVRVAKLLVMYEIPYPNINWLTLINLKEESWDMARIITRQVNFEHESVTNGLVLPLNERHSIVTCSCKSFIPSHLSHFISEDSPCIGQEMNVRQRRGRIVVLDGGAGEVDEHQQEGVVNVIHASEFLRVNRKREEDREKYDSIYDEQY